MRRRDLVKTILSLPLLPAAVRAAPPEPEPEEEVRGLVGLHEATLKQWSPNPIVASSDVFEDLQRAKRRI